MRCEGARISKACRKKCCEATEADLKEDKKKKPSSDYLESVYDYDSGYGE